MRPLVRTLCLWLLLLALPLQGVTAATMAHCGAARDVAVAMAHAGHAGHAGHDHAAMQAAAAHGDEDAGTPGKSVHPGAHACSACAACCMALGLPAALPVLPEPEVGPVAALPAGAPAERFVTGGLERPPRTAAR